MKKEDKSIIIDKISANLQEYEHFYLTDIASLDAQKTSSLRRECSSKNIMLMVVKNTLLRKAFERQGINFDELFPLLKGNTAIMFTRDANAPAKLIEKYNKDKQTVPALKGAYVQESFFVGANTLKDLVNIKSKAELIGEVITILQSPAKNVISALQSGGTILHGVLQTLSEKEN